MIARTRLLGERYEAEVDATLGQGGMAQVYRGTDTVLGRVVAIKVLAPQYAKDQAFVERFRREAQAAARLNHPGVVSVSDTGSDAGIHYIVMEYVDGRTLHEVLRSEGRLQPERAAEVLAQVAEALSFAHHAGIVHRDVKPANIMIGRGGEVKVMDFGIARAVASTATLTATATVLGTASYLSPEQAQGEAVDHRSDIYSLGVVAYECLVGEPPFVADTPVAVAYKHVREDPVPPSRVVPEIPADLEAVVMKAMAKNPANRYASAAEMKQDLERFVRGEAVTAESVMAEPPTEALPVRIRTASIPTSPLGVDLPPNRRWAGALITAFMVVLVLGGVLGGLALTRHGGPVEGGRFLPPDLRHPQTTVPTGSSPRSSPTGAPAPSPSPSPTASPSSSPSPTASPTPSPSVSLSPSPSPSPSPTISLPIPTTLPGLTSDPSASASASSGTSPSPSSSSSPSPFPSISL